MSIALVGAGPGAADLLTVRAARILAEAEVVVHDALVGSEIFGLLGADVELIDVGKRPGESLKQARINSVLIDLARTGKRVVRLKGGDPFVFGRGGEEAIALAEAGFSCEIVPGISSAIAAPEVAGIPVTHRGVSPAFTVVTGHRRNGETEVNWASLAQVGGTIVVLMGVSERAAIAAGLLAGGLSPSTPVAAIRSATGPNQEVIRGTLGQLVDLPLRSPSVMVIGAVAAMDVHALAASVTTL